MKLMPLARRLAALALVPALAACATGDGAAAGEGRLRVTATTGMVADLAQNIGAERVAVSALMGPGVDPHLYKPAAGDVRKLEHADLILYNGLHLEGRMGELFENMAAAGKVTVPVSRDIPAERLHTTAAYEGQYDPHIWFDVDLWQIAARTVAEALTAADPAGAETYHVNLAAYLERLAALDAYAQDQVASLPEASRVLVTAHDAFGYFGDRYGLEVHGLQGASTAAEAGAADVQRLAAFIAERRIKAIFVESSVAHRNLEAVRAAVRARGWEVAIGGELFSDAMGDAGTPEGTYEGMVRHNVDTIVEALR